MGDKSSCSKDLQGFDNIVACHYEQIKGLICEADFCTVLVPNSNEIERFAHSAGSETLGAWKKSKAVIQPLDCRNIDKRAKQKFSVIAKKLDCFVAKLFAPRNDMRKIAAFTLAEVLITLGIIGVVAAMTLPALIQNYQKQVLVNQLKANVSILENALGQIAEDAGGSLAYTSFGRSIEGSATYNMSFFRPFVRDYLKKHVKINRAVCEGSSYDYCPDGKLTEKYYKTYLEGANSTQQRFRWAAVELENGAFVQFFSERNYNCGEAPYANLSSMKTICGSVEIDVNGEKNPNQYGRDVFTFYFDDHGHLFPDRGQATSLAFTGNLDNSEKYWKKGSNSMGLYLCCSKEKDGCRWSQGLGCAARIVESGWKMDY